MLLLGLTIPVLRPILLHINSPELLALNFGLSMVSALSGLTTAWAIDGRIWNLAIDGRWDPQTGQSAGRSIHCI